jgi:GAF domain-containing protein
VDTFVQVYREIAPKDIAQPELQSAVRRIRGAHKAEAVSAPPVVDVVPAPQPDSSEEVLAFVSLARVATHTPTVRDVGALAWGHLRHLAPGASVALYTIDASRGALVAQYSAGPAGVRLSGMVINVSERVTGWVAATSRPMVNAEAQLDLGPEAAEDLRYAIAMPLLAHGTLVGVMTLYAPEAFSDDRARRLEMIAPHLAMSIAAATADADRGRSTRPDLRVVSRR